MSQFLISALIIAVMGCFLTSFTFVNDILSEKDRLRERMELTATGLMSAYAGYAIQGIEPDLEILKSVVYEYDEKAEIRMEASDETYRIYKEGKRMYASFGILLGGEKYTVSSFLNVHHVYENLNSLIFGYRVIFIGAFFALMGGIYIASDSIVKPVLALTKAAKAFQTGDKSARANVKSNGEIREMALTFNSMAETIAGEMNRQQSFIQNLTHEMKTPLSAIIGHADLVRLGKVKDTEAMLAAQTVLKEAERLDKLSKSLTGLILTGEDQTEMKNTQVMLILGEVRDAFSEHGIEITVCGRERVIETDRVLLKTLLVNLVDNSINAGAKNITLESGEKAIIRVLDDGCGMTEAEIRQAAEPFWRADKARSRAHGGAGLGLALSERIAVLLGGSIEIKSKKGVGTEIQVKVCEVKPDA
ncbi:MAG: HAMP domain-containing histidine kinase [Clostridia bacterium]|nr:HAMP domain-containing histidine kinase [Clostridia bacterium]